MNVARPCLVALQSVSTLPLSAMDRNMTMPVSRTAPAARTALVVALAVLVLGGCATRATSFGGGIIGANGGTASGPYLSALQGGIVARSGLQLSGADSKRALEAEYRALEEAAAGQSIAWKGSGASGTVVAAAPYQVGAQNCRQYRHTLDAAGKQALARGTACRNADGTWTPLT